MLHVPRMVFYRYLLPIVLTVSLISSFIGCDKNGEKLTQPNEEVPQQILYNFSTKHTEAGITKWMLVADSAEFRKEIVHVQNPTVQIFQDGKLAITVTGNRGEIIQPSNDIHIFDDVVGTSQDGVLYTNELQWRNKDGKLYAPNESKIVRGDSTMVGQAMECDPSLDVVTMKNVQGRIYPKDEKIDASKS